MDGNATGHCRHSKAVTWVLDLKGAPSFQVPLIGLDLTPQLSALESTQTNRLNCGELQVGTDPRMN